MRRPVRGDDRGIAALEVALFSTVLLLIGFGALPLYSMLRASQGVSKASAATLRYATGVASNGTRTAGGTLSRRPTYDQIESFAKEAAGDPDLDVTVTVCKTSGACTDVTAASPEHASPIPAASGDTVRLTLRTTVDLSMLGRLANATSRITGRGTTFPENDTTLTATASAREE